jgi:hypothetical protein
MKAWRRFEDWANMVLGAYLFFVPFFVAANAAVRKGGRPQDRPPT